jgi:hypothetical protein
VCEAEEAIADVGEDVAVDDGDRAKGLPRRHVEDVGLVVAIVLRFSETSKVLGAPQMAWLALPWRQRKEGSLKLSRHSLETPLDRTTSSVGSLSGISYIISLGISLLSGSGAAMVRRDEGNGNSIVVTADRVRALYYLRFKE